MTVRGGVLFQMIFASLRPPLGAVPVCLDLRDERIVKGKGEERPLAEVDAVTKPGYGLGKCFMQGGIGRGNINRENIQVQAEPIHIAALAFDADGADILNLGITLDKLASV